MGMCLPIFLIVTGVFILLMAGVLTVGFDSIVKTAVPISMNFLPLNQTMNLFVDIPLTAHVKASLTEASTSKDISNRTLALGEIGFMVEMGDWDQDAEDTFPIVWVEEKAAIDEVMRYLLVMSDGPVNYVKTYVGLLGGGLIFFSIIVGLIRLTTK